MAQIAAAARAAAHGLVVTAPAWLDEALSAANAGAVVERAHTRVSLPPARDARLPHEPLTPREREVLQQLVLGRGNRAIADALGISLHTAKFHVAQILAKLAAASRTDAVTQALRAGLVEL